MKISGKRLIIFVEKEYGDTLTFSKMCKSKNTKRLIKKQLKSKIKNYLNSILKEE